MTTANPAAALLKSHNEDVSNVLARLGPDHLLLNQDKDFIALSPTQLRALVLFLYDNAQEFFPDREPIPYVDPDPAKGYDEEGEPF